MAQLGLLPIDRWLRPLRLLLLLTDGPVLFASSAFFFSGLFLASRDLLPQLHYQVILAAQLLLQQLGLPFQTLNLLGFG